MNYIKLGDISSIATGPFGSQLHQSDYSEKGTPVVMPKDLINGSIVEDGIARVSEEHVNRLKRHILHTGDIVFARRGDVGRCAYVSDKEDGWLCGTGCFKVVIDTKKASPKYVFCHCQDSGIVEWIKCRAVGATLPNLNTSIISKVPINLPPLVTQKGIASILSAYDTLTEVNKKKIKNLEETISLLFKKWFIWTEKTGWENKRLGEIIYQKKSKLNNWDNLDIVDLSSMPSFSMTLQSYSNPEDFTTNIFKLDKMDLLFGAIRPYLGKAGFAPKDCAVAGTVLHFKVRDELYYYYTLALITSKYFFDYANCVASGTKMPVIKFDDICRYTITIPSERLFFQSFNKIVSPMVEELKNLSVQNANLTHQRDLLLPRLMSGKLSI